jgi:hypothetical protein
VKILVEFEGLRDVVCFKENKIACPNAKRAAIELETQTHTSEGNLRMKATKSPMGTSAKWNGLSSPDLAYTTTMCLA